MPYAISLPFPAPSLSLVPHPTSTVYAVQLVYVIAFPCLTLALLSLWTCWPADNGSNAKPSSRLKSITLTRKAQLPIVITVLAIPHHNCAHLSSHKRNGRPTTLDPNAQTSHLASADGTAYVTLAKPLNCSCFHNRNQNALYLSQSPSGHNLLHLHSAHNTGRTALHNLVWRLPASTFSVSITIIGP
jgi:hypothetical protein